jgi:hypothetical protein
MLDNARVIVEGELERSVQHVPDAVLGRAAKKILAGEVTNKDLATLTLMQLCPWCVPTRTYRKACLQHAAQMLAEHGLRPWPEDEAIEGEDGE